jgi:hypothetical protein
LTLSVYECVDDILLTRGISERGQNDFFFLTPLGDKSKGKRQLLKGISRLFFLFAVFPYYLLARGWPSGRKGHFEALRSSLFLLYYRSMGCFVVREGVYFYKNVRDGLSRV